MEMALTHLETPQIIELLRGFYTAYRERFDELAPDRDPPLPLLALQALDLVRVNGGRALHFFFSQPDERMLQMSRRITRLHDIEVFPSSTEELKGLEDGEPDSHREQVMRTADIGGPVYVHFIIYPEDGMLPETLADVAERVAEREVKAGHEGAPGPADPTLKPSVMFAAPPPETGAPDPTRDWIQPAP